MSQFKYTLPSGAEFVVDGPAGATQAQADRVFYEQVAAGSLVGYESGQTLTSLATSLNKFELSRLERGTAGVDTPTILAIVQGLPVVSGIPNLNNTPLQNPINQADIVLIKGDTLGPAAIGPLSSYDVQKIQSQIKNYVDQNYTQISNDKGIGQYGFTAYALEEAGYVKPGTSLRFFAVDPEDFVSVMSSPSVWTGNNGIYSLADLLTSAETQTLVQTEIMEQGYASLQSSGVITNIPQAPIKLSQGQVFTNSGLASVSQLIGLNAAGIGLGSLQGLVTNALTSNTALSSLLSAGNINLSTIGSGAINSLSQGLDSLGNLANLNFASLSNNITSKITGDVGALVANASKFGSQAATLWSQTGLSGTLSNLTGGLSGQLSGITGQLTNLSGGLTNGLNQITGQLTNLIPGSLSNLTSSMDLLGKGSQFATVFANPLSSLNNLGNLGNLGNLSSLTNLGALQGQLTGALTGQLGQLTGALQGQLGSLSGALTGQLGSLSGALTGQLGSLSGILGNFGSLANFGAVGSLFGGGGDLVSGTQVAAGFNNTVNRATVDSAFRRILGSNKIPAPSYEYPGLASLGPRLDIQQAQNILKNFQTGAETRIFGQGVTI